jgi:predicted secreted protein
MMRTATLILGILLAGPAAAETLLHLSESARVMVQPDELAASLRVEAVTASAAEAQAQVNTAMAGAVALARQTAGVRVTTGSYTVWPQTTPQAVVRPGGRQDWRASQTLELRSGDGAVLLTLVGALQQRGLAVSQLGWQVAAETERHARAEATKQALGSLRVRAEEAADVLGLHFDSFREVRLDAIPRPRPLPMRAMTAASAAPPPTAEAEPVPVEASVEADVVLK